MNNEKQYTFKFVETVINLMESLSPNTRDEVFVWAANNGKSGIDSWRDFIVDHARNFERITADIDWNADPPTDYIDAVDAYGELIDGAPAWTFPTKDELFRSIEQNNELVRLEGERDELEDRIRKIFNRILEIKGKKGDDK